MQSYILMLYVFLGLVLSSCWAATVHVTMNITQFMYNADGVETLVYGANGQTNYVIRVRKGDTLVAHVINNLNQPTSIHWHGINQKNTVHYDGTDMVSQCSIQVSPHWVTDFKPGSSLVYRLTIADQAGTFWWHSHRAAQYTKGLRGPLIVEDPQDPYAEDYDEDYIIMLSDWYHGDLDQLLPAFLAKGGTGIEPIPNSVVMNDRGRFSCHPMNRTDSADCMPYPAFHVHQGRRYRFRVINVAAMGTFRFSVDQHKMTIIEADGITTVKTTVDYFNISSAQRYSFIIEPKDPSFKNGRSFWVKALMNTNMWPIDISNLTNPEGRAVLQYHDATKDAEMDDVILPEVLIPQMGQERGLNLYHLFPLEIMDIPQEADVSFSLHFQFLRDPRDDTFKSLVELDGYSEDDPSNVYSYQSPSVPTLFDVIQHGTSKPLPKSSNAVYIKRGQVVDITVYNPETEEHPFHLQHSFWVIEHGQGLNLASKRQGKRRLQRGLNDPQQSTFPYRDTIGITGCKRRPDGNSGGEGACGGGKGFTRIRFIADNPGAWLFHCHMEWHMMAGLAITIVVDAEGLAQNHSIPEDILNTCKSVSHI